MWLSLITSLALSATVLAAPSKNASPTAQVKNGTIVGVHSASYNQDFFLGVPFAQPPLGDLRFRQAQPLNTTWKGARDTKQYATHCVGYGVSRILGSGEHYVLTATARSNLLRSLRRLLVP
jgi:hypothetical protein